MRHLLLDDRLSHAYKVSERDICPFVFFELVCEENVTERDGEERAREGERKRKRGGEGGGWRERELRERERERQFIRKDTL